MLTGFLVVLCLSFMAYLSHHWLFLTFQMQDEHRQKRMLEHLNWRPIEKDTPKGKRRWF